MINGDTQLSITFMFALIGVIATIYNIAKSNKKDDESNEEKIKKEKEKELERIMDTKEGFLKVNLKLDELCRGNNAIQLLLDRQTEELKDLTNKAFKNSNDITTLFRYKDDLQKRIETIEHKEE